MGLAWKKLAIRESKHNKVLLDRYLKSQQRERNLREILDKLVEPAGIRVIGIGLRRMLDKYREDLKVPPAAPKSDVTTEVAAARNTKKD